MTEMGIDPIVEKTNENLPKTFQIGVFGCALGLLALLLCFISKQIKDPSPPPPPSLFDKAKEVINKKLKFHGKEQPVASRSSPTLEEQYKEELAQTKFLRHTIRIAGGVLGVLALTCGIFGYVRKENPRLVKTSIALAFIAIGFEYAMVALAVCLFLLLLSAFA